MNKIARLNSTLQGDFVDRPPFSFWYHFGLQHAKAERVAQTHLEFFQAYDLDFLKVMNDYAYPESDNQEEFFEVSDWEKLKVFSGDEGGFGKQLKALSIIGQELAGSAYFVETIFSPWTIARKLSDKETLIKLKNNHPKLLLEIMEKIALSLANYAEKVVSIGTAGIFLSLSGANPNVMTYQEYERFARPFDLMILERIKTKTKFNILHIHGDQIYFNELLDYPVQAINWSHYYAKPSLSQARQQYKGCLLGGINEKLFSHSTISAVKKEINETIKELGTKNLIITPGCSIEPDSPQKQLNSVKKALTK